MKQLTFFRACLLVPYALAGLIELSCLLGANPSEPWLTIFLYLVLAVVAGGIPYGDLVVLLWVWLPGKSAKAVRIAFAAAPLCLLAAFGALDSLRFMWRAELLVSYAYVGLFLLTEQVFRGVGLVRDDAPADLRVQAS